MSIVTSSLINTTEIPHAVYSNRSASRKKTFLEGELEAPE